MTHKCRSGRRCNANAHKGTGIGVCDRLLDGHGQCDRAGDHVETLSAAPRADEAIPRIPTSGPDERVKLPNGREHYDEALPRMAAYRAARDWADQHGHPQPDDRMIDAALASFAPLVTLIETQIQTVLGAPDEVAPMAEPTEPRSEGVGDINASRQHGVAWWGFVDGEGVCSCCGKTAPVRKGLDRTGEPASVRFCDPCTSPDHMGCAS